MGQLVLLVVAAAWAAVLVPPLLRSRIENRPNSSVTDFRNQLSSLQRAMPSRGVAMRSMSRPLAPVAAQPSGGARPTTDALGRPHPRRQQQGSQHRPAARLPGRPLRRHATGPQPRRRRARGVPPLPADQPSRRGEAAPRQRAVRPRSRRRLLAVPRRHDQGRGDALRVRRRLRRPVRVRLRARPDPPARAAALPAEVVAPAERQEPHRRRHTEVRRSAAHRATVRRQTADRWSHAV